MNFAPRLALGIALIVIGVAAFVVSLISDINNGPSWLHVISWVAGGLTVGGISTIRLAYAYPSGRVKEGNPRRL